MCQDVICSKLKTSQLAKIQEEHMHLSIALGKPIGLIALNEYDDKSPSDYSEEVLDSIYEGTYDVMKLSQDFGENPYGRTILHFLRSKDDSLLLLVTSLLYTFTMLDTIAPAILFESNLYPIGQR